MTPESINAWLAACLSPGTPPSHQHHSLGGLSSCQVWQCEGRRARRPEDLCARL